MSSQQKTTFTENKFIHIIDLKTVKAKEAMELSIEYLKNDASMTSDVFNTWCTKLLRFFGVEAVQYDELKELFSLHYDYINELIESMIPIDELNDTDLTIIKTNLEGWRNIFEWLKEVVKDLSLLDLSIILQTALKTLQKYNIFALKRRRFKNNEESVFHILKESQLFLTEVLSFFSDNPTIFICKSQVCMEIIVLMVLNLCTVGELVALIDIKATAQTWKCVTTLSTDNSDYFKRNFEWNIGPNWLCRPVKYLVGEIERTIQTVYQNQEQNNEPIDLIERQLKITSFYLKLLIKISSGYQHEFFPNCREVINFMAFALNPPNHIIGSKTEALFKQYLFYGFSSLLNYIYKNRDFRQLCLEKITSDTEYHTGILISFDVLKSLLAETQENIINEFIFSNDSNIFDEIFKRIPSNKHITQTSEVFENIIQISSALFITNVNNKRLVSQLEILFVNGVVQSDEVLGNVCINIWLIIARFAEVSYRYGYLTFWWSCRKRISFPSYEPVAFQIDTLIQSMYDILPVTLQTKFWHNLNETELENALTVLGIDRYPDGIAKKLLINKLSIQIYQKLQNPDESFETENYFKFVISLKILSTTKLENKNNICNLVAKFLTILTKNNEVIETFCTLFNLLCEFVSNKIDEIEPATVTNLLSDINWEITKFENFHIKQTLQKMVTSLQNNPLYDNLSRNCLMSLKTNNSSNDKKLNMKLNEENENRESFNNNSKRMKVDESIHELLKTILKNVQDLNEYFNAHQLNSSEKVLIVEIINSLNKISRNEK